MLKRELNLPISHDFLLLGPRQTGKTTLVSESFNRKTTQVYNLLQSEQFTRFVSNPGLLKEEIFALPKEITHIFIDEVQRVPELLNEVQYLIDQRIPQKFILSGSSARKLKRGRGNLLAGRVWAFNLYPLTFQEIHKTKLTEILTYGTLPKVVTSKLPQEKNETLRSYVEVYLKEEIEAEALSRNIGGFIRFLSIAAQSNGELINFSNIARDTGISSVTVKEYFKILEDTLIGSFLFPFSYSERKKHKLSPKFYLFDTGILRALHRKLSLEILPMTFEFGMYFESWIINEVIRINSYLRKDWNLSFLRTAKDVEVDLIIETPKGKIIAVEIKSKPNPIAQDYEAGFKALRSLTPKIKCYCVCACDRPRLTEGVEILPYDHFFKLLREL